MPLMVAVANGATAVRTSWPAPPPPVVTEDTRSALPNVLTCAPSPSWPRQSRLCRAADALEGRSGPGADGQVRARAESVARERRRGGRADGQVSALACAGHAQRRDAPLPRPRAGTTRGEHLEGELLAAHIHARIRCPRRCRAARARPRRVTRNRVRLLLRRRAGDARPDAGRHRAGRGAAQGDAAARAGRHRRAVRGDEESAAVDGRHAARARARVRLVRAREHGARRRDARRAARCAACATAPVRGLLTAFARPVSRSYFFLWPRLMASGSNGHIDSREL
eukprot:4570749-Prymnesium_polylepis.2